MATQATKATQERIDRAGQAANELARTVAQAAGMAVEPATEAFGEAYGAAHPASVDNGEKVGAARTGFSASEARQVGERIGIDWTVAPFDVEQFRVGMGVELEHGFRDAVTNVTDDDPTFTGKIALAHLNEFA